MAVDFAHYDGREQTFVKHTFLDKYLPRLVGKVCSPNSRYNEFVYVDGFAGPWKSAAGETFEDTSFGIALNHMTAQRLFYLGKSHDVKMRAVLVEKDPNSFDQLQQAILRFPKNRNSAAARIDGGPCRSHCVKYPVFGFFFHFDRPEGFPRH